MRFLKERPPSGGGGTRSGTVRFRPRLEVLESRTVPTSFQVTNLLDAGTGSLRQAILDANAHPGADRIDFAYGLHGVIALTSGQLGITDDLKIAGPAQVGWPSAAATAAVSLTSATGRRRPSPA